MKLLLRNPIYSAAILSGTTSALIGYLIAQRLILAPAGLTILLVLGIVDLKREWKKAEEWRIAMAINEIVERESAKKQSLA